MNNREKLLGGFVLVILVSLGARSVHNRLGDAHTFYVAQEKAKSDALLNAKKATRDGQNAAKRLRDWRERSLPSDPTQANLNYESWLRDQLESAGIKVVTPKVAFSHPDEKSTLLTYTVVGEGKLGALTDFLYRFYRARHLHKIDSLQVTPVDQSETLKLTMKVEAYSLRDAASASALAQGDSERLALSSPEEYRESIVGRNIFAVYTPPKPQEEAVETAAPAAPPPFDHARHAIATGIVEWNNKPQVWINVQTTGDKHRLFAGETFKVNDLTVKIIEIGTRNVIFEADGETYSVKLGKSLRDGEPIDLDKAG